MAAKSALKSLGKAWEDKAMAKIKVRGDILFLCIVMIVCLMFFYCFRGRISRRFQLEYWETFSNDSVLILKK